MSPSDAEAVLAKSRRLLIVSRNLLRLMSSRVESQGPIGASSNDAPRKRAGREMTTCCGAAGELASDELPS